MNNNFLYLNFINFTDVSLWDFKRYAAQKFASSYPIVKLGDYIQEENTKVKPFDFPDKDFPILGVNNKTGLFDAYIEKGSNINQPYKVVKDGFLAYNPYRVNVGSIGLKTAEQKYNYISPAYVVFSCRQGLLPEFLYILFRTSKFNALIRESTTGSVRQTLSFSSMGNIEIPLPSIEKQREIIDKYNEMCQTAVNLKKQAVDILEKISSLFRLKLGIQTNANDASKVGFRTIPFSKITKWSIAKLSKSQTYLFGKSKFECRNVKDLISQMSGGKTPSTGNSAYWQEGDVCWTSAKDMKDLFLKATEDHITKAAVHENSLTIHQPGTILAVFRSGILRHSFPIAISTVPTTINQDLKAIKLNNDLILDKYFLFYFYFMQKLVLESAMKTGVTVESIDVDAFLKIPVVVPPLPEQQNIMAQIDKVMQKIQNLKSKADIIKIEAQQQFEKELFE
ncbi:MAG: restriction endonuclease subunit S [Lentisphaeria bacterium]|nr:restriction endonuclease subunit S [Lentisphaeria bacterium]